MFTAAANSIAFALVAIPVLTFYAFTGALAPAIILLPCCMLAQEGYLRSGQAWRGCNEFYQFCLIALGAPLLVCVVPFTLFWFLGGISGCIGNKCWFDWTTLNFVAVIMPSILYLALRGIAWAQSHQSL